MEYILLAKVGMAVEWIVRCGYIFAGSYIVRTGVRYAQDYKHSIEREKVEVD